MDFVHTGGRGCSSAAHCPGQTDDEYRTAFAIWCLVQSPLIVDTDVRSMTPVMTETLLNKELIEIHQSTQTPPGRHAGNWLCQDLPGVCQIWTRRLSKDTDDFLVALVNLGNRSHDITVTWDTLGLKTAKALTVRDLWKHTDLTQATSRFTANVPQHGTQVLRLREASGLIV